MDKRVVDFVKDAQANNLSPEACAQVSIAMSLKRIANSLDRVLADSASSQLVLKLDDIVKILRGTPPR